MATVVVIQNVVLVTLNILKLSNVENIEKFTCDSTGKSSGFSICI